MSHYNRPYPRRGLWNYNCCRKQRQYYRSSTRTDNYDGEFQNVRRPSSRFDGYENYNGQWQESHEDWSNDLQIKYEDQQQYSQQFQKQPDCEGNYYPSQAQFNYYPSERKNRYRKNYSSNNYFRSERHSNHTDPQSKETEIHNDPDQPMLKKLLQHIETDQYNRRSKHEIHKIWYEDEVTDERNNIITRHPNLPSELRADGTRDNNTKAEMLNEQKTSNPPTFQIVMYSSNSSDDALQGHNGIQENFYNKETESECNNIQKMLPITNALSQSDNNVDMEVPKIILKKSSTESRDWSIKNPTKNDESFVEAKIISSTDDLHEEPMNTSSPLLNSNNTSYHVEELLNQNSIEDPNCISTQNGLEERQQILHRKELCENRNVVTTASLLDAQDENSMSCPMNSVPSPSNTGVVACKSVLTSSTLEHEKKICTSSLLCNKSNSSIAVKVHMQPDIMTIISKDLNKFDSSSIDEDVITINEDDLFIEDANDSIFSAFEKSSGSSLKRKNLDNQPLPSISKISRVIIEGQYEKDSLRVNDIIVISSDDESSTEDINKSDESFLVSNNSLTHPIQETNNQTILEEVCNPKLISDSSVFKRKKQPPESVSKKSKIVSEKPDEKFDDITIVLSSDSESPSEDINKLDKILSKTCSNITNKHKNVPVLSKTKIKRNPVQRSPPSTLKDMYRVELIKSLSINSSSNSKHKVKQPHSWPVSNTAPGSVNKISRTSNLSSKPEGKQKSLVKHKCPIVLLKRLTQAEIFKFSVKKNILDRSVYHKDLLTQFKYFLNCIYYYSILNYKVSIALQDDNANKDLCSKIFCISKESYCAFVEVKYLQKNSEPNRINYKTLSNPEFDIKKYYKSFLDFRKCYNKKLHLIKIHTNLELSIEAFENNGIEIKIDQNNLHQLVVKEGHELHRKFLKCCILPNLADLLSDCFQQKKQKNFNTDLIKKYHLALVKEKVLVIDTKKCSNGIAKFHQDFIFPKSLSGAAKELRRLILERIPSHTISSQMEFVLTNDSFGKDIILDANPEVDPIKIADVLVNSEQKKLLPLKNELKKILGYVLRKIDNDIYGFTNDFFRGTNLPGNLKLLRRQVMNLCEHQKKEFFELCRSTIFINDFCHDHPVQKLPDENCNKLFKEFFDIFGFVVIRKNVDSFVNGNLGEDFRRINDETCVNILQEELLTRIEEQNLGKDSLNSMKNLICKCKVTNISFQHLQSKINIEFKTKALNMLEAKLHKYEIALCVTQSVPLTILKVKQLSSDIFHYTESKETLFITNKTFLEMTSDVLNAFAHRSTNLLVIQWDNRLEKNEQIMKVFGNLKDIISQGALDKVLKLVIVIVHNNNYSAGPYAFDTLILDHWNSFDLSEDCQVKLLQTENVSLQHRRLSLKANLIDDKYVPDLLNSPVILSQLLTGKLSIGKDLIKPHGFKEFYFKTQIKQCIIIDPSIFHEEIGDVFIIRNIDRKDLERYLPSRAKIFSPNDVPASMRINAKYILLGFNISAWFFDNYAENNQEHSVHLLRYQSGSFIWEKTKGNNTDLLRNRIEDTGDLLKIQKTEDVLCAGPKIVIICGESGSGKSVCLYNLARETKNLYKTETIDAFWPVQIHLDKARLFQYIRNDVNIVLEKNFVAKFLCDYLSLDDVHSKLMTMIFQNQLKLKLVLFFDNYEELPPSYRNFVIELFRELQVSYCEKIYVSSTPSTRSHLENALGVFAYTLEFSEVEKVQFLQSFWSKSLGEIELVNEAGGFIDHYGKVEVSDDDLTTIPLHLRMLAEMFSPNDNDYTPVEAIDQLYKLYIEHKCMKDEENAILFSLRRILSEDQLKNLNLEKKKLKKDFVLPGDLRHSSFYEYFSAKYLASLNHCVTISSYINNLLDSVSPLFLKIYFAQLNATNDSMVKMVSEFAVHGHLNIVKTMLVHCKEKLPLTAIVQSTNPNALEVVRFLLNHYNDTKEDQIMLHGEYKKPKYAESNVVRYVNTRDKSKKETPLEVAARMKKIPIACELLLKGATMKGIKEEFISELARYIADEMCKTDSTWIHPIAEKLLKLRPEAVGHLDKIDEYPRLLSYFFTHGRVDLINFLLKNDRDRYNILISKVNDKSPLDLVNDSRVLSDDERLEIAKYIVSNVGEDLERKNKYYLGNALMTAAECNHEQTFEYFIGKYPDKHMGFLQFAMRRNRLDLMRFLMRKTDRMMYLDDNTALHRAISLGVSPMTVKFLINRGGIDNKNKSGETSLCVAFKEGQEFELVEYLIKMDAYLFAKDELGLYPWCYAILDDSKYTANEQVDLMKYLQEKVKLKAPETEQKISFESDQKRKEVARKLKYFQNPEAFVPNLQLHLALKSNDESWIRFLVLHGANVNHIDTGGRTPLHVAIEFKRYKLAKMLLDHGAMFNVRDKSKLTPLKLLTISDDNSKESKEIKQLLESATKLFNNNIKNYSSVSRHLINSRDRYMRTLLHIAARIGNVADIKDIIKQSKEYCINKNFPSLDINAKDVYGKTPLNVVKEDNAEVAAELLVNGAVFEPATTSLLQSARKLVQAVKDKDVKKAKELIKNNVCLVNARDDSGKSCLHWAASYNSREIMEVALAERVLDVDALDSSMQTPLYYATENDNIACVVLLLKAGASYDVKNKQGYLPFDVNDKMNESVKLLKKIHEMFLDIKSDEPRILVNNHPDALVEYLSEINETWHVPKDIVVNVVDRNKNTLLHTAARYDFTSVVDNLLKQGAIYNVKNKWRKTPESMALSTKQVFKTLNKAFEKLTINSWANLDSELVVNCRMVNGYTLLHQSASAGKEEEVKWLTENGADVKATNNRGSKIKCDKKKFPAIDELLESKCEIM